MPRNYRNRELVYVTMSESLGSLKYGFQTGLKDSDKATFGQTAIDANTAVTGLVIGANSPKPHRATIKDISGSISSWCSADKVSSLRTAGATIAPPKRRYSRTTQVSKTVYVTINGVKYGWQYTTAGVGTVTIADVGVVDATKDDLLVFGASFPKPARFATDLVGGGEDAPINSFSIFVDPSKEDNIPEGWRGVSARKDSLNL